MKVVFMKGGKNISVFDIDPINFILPKIGERVTFSNLGAVTSGVVSAFEHAFSSKMEPQVSRSIPATWTSEQTITITIQ